MSNIFVGIPCFGGVSSKVYEDHMRLAFWLGRRMPEFNFFLGVKPKSEQFRARNAIVKEALRLGCDYLWMLDDDMILDIDDVGGVSDRYNVIPKFLKVMNSTGAAIVGVRYYHRGGDCLPVMMNRLSTGQYTFLKDHEIGHGPQEVDVAGGGSLFIDMKIFDKIEPPYFAPEFEWGTDIQLCTKAKDAGFKVVVDTSIEFGHETNQTTVVTSRNRHMVYAATQEDGVLSEHARNWYVQGPMQEFVLDAVDYLNMPMEKIIELACEYPDKAFPEFPGGTDAENQEYYRKLGELQVARQVAYHYANDHAREFMEMCFRMLLGRGGRVLDFACGSAPIGFEIARHGAEVYFVDLDGAGGFEFLKWRLRKQPLAAHCYDSEDLTANDIPNVGCVILSDAIEHFENWKSVLDFCVGRLENQGALITNFFVLGSDPRNVEHISMDKEAVQEYLVSLNVYPLNSFVWIKNPVLEVKK